MDRSKISYWMGFIYKFNQLFSDERKSSGRLYNGFLKNKDVKDIFYKFIEQKYLIISQ